MGCRVGWGAHWQGAQGGRGRSVGQRDRTHTRTRPKQGLAPETFRPSPSLHPSHTHPQATPAPNYPYAQATTPTSLKGYSPRIVFGVQIFPPLHWLTPRTMPQNILASVTVHHSTTHPKNTRLPQLSGAKKYPTLKPQRGKGGAHNLGTPNFPAPKSVGGMRKAKKKRH